MSVKYKRFACAGLLAAGVSGLSAQTPSPLPPAKTDAPGVAQTPEVPPASALVPPQVVEPAVSGPAGCATCAASGDDFWTRPNLTGDWGGLRTRLKENGIHLNGNLTQFGFGLSGGLQRRRLALPALELGDTAAYTGRGEYEMKLELEKFGGMPKGTLTARVQHWFGNYGNVSLNSGAFSPPIFAAAIPPMPNDPGTLFLTDFFVTQPLSKEWIVFAGKKNVLGAADQDKFAGGNGTMQFSNQALVANPAFLLGLPYTSFTAGFVSPREWGAFSAFVYDPEDRTNVGFRPTDLFSEGVIVGGEVRVKTNLFNMPGDAHVGGMWKHVELTNLRFAEPPPGVYPEPTVPGFPTLRESYTIYSGFDQYLQVYSCESNRGWGLFGRASISDGNPTPIQYFLSLGVGGYSPFAYHRGDTFGIGWYYVGASPDFGPLPRNLVGPRDGTGVEVWYNFQVTPWMNLTPDFQVIKPEAGAIAKTSYIGGLRLNLKF